MNTPTKHQSAELLFSARIADARMLLAGLSDALEKKERGLERIKRETGKGANYGDAGDLAHLNDTLAELLELIDCTRTKEAA